MRLKLQDIDGVRRHARALRGHLRFLVRDIGNLAIYGSDGPRSAQRIWVDPRMVTSTLAATTALGRHDSGTVLGGDWDRCIEALDRHPKHIACVEHFVNGRSWDETGIFDFMRDELSRRGRFDGCKTMHDVYSRYEALDQLYADLSSEKRFLTRQQLLGRAAYRESGAVYVHVGRDARPIFGRGGYHRLAIAQIIGLPSIPAQLGVVHREAVSDWRFHYQSQRHATEATSLA